MIILPFIEGVLGYEIISANTSGGFWHYRKTVELKKFGY